MIIKTNKIMKFKKFLSYFKSNESIKEDRLDEILDKISNKIKLDKSEQDFLDRYNEISDNDMIGFEMMSFDSTFRKITELLEDGKKVICNLSDKDGKIGIEIDSIYNDYEREVCRIKLKNGEKFILKDNFLYNILFDMRKNEYSLEYQDEFFEKLPVKND